MDVLIWLIGLLIVAIGVAGVILPAIPGAPLVWVGLFILAWVGDFQRVGWETLLVLGTLTAFSFLVDFLTVSYGAKRFGATRQAAWGAVIGTGIGLFFGLPGLLVGPFLGAFIGELMSIGDLSQATRAGVGSWIGLVLGVCLKLALTFAMIGVFVFAFLF